MKTFTSAALLAGLASTVSGEWVTGLSVRSASPVHFLPVTASGFRLHLNGKTSSYCPSSVVENCPNSTVTSFGVGGSSVSMGAEVPGGQQVWIDPKDGAVGYTQAHSVSAPEGAIFDGWSWEYRQSNNLGNLSNKYGLIACPAETNGVWDIYAQVPDVSFTADCLGFDFVTSNTTGPTQWQYI